MNRTLWGWLIAAGLLLARLGYVQLQADLTDVATTGAAVPDVTVLVLLTGGLLAGLFGVTGLVGLLGWVPRPGVK